MKTIKFTRNCFYHIYNRGVDKRDIFAEDKDYLRFIHSLYKFNDKRFASPHRSESKEVASKNAKRSLLVNILCFCLMPNHFHLILQPIVEGGITKFMRKLGTGYTLYFNAKYKRNGVLFQGQFKAILIDKDEYLIHLSRYIHLNPAELIDHSWEKSGTENWNRTARFLERYRWSSFLDYLGIENFPSIIHKDFLQTYFKDTIAYKKFIEDFLVKDIAEIRELIVE